MITLALDIGSFSIKLAELQSSGKSFAIRRLEEFPLSTDPNKDKKIEILDLLRRLPEQYDPEETRLVLVVPQGRAILRLRTFPFRERYKIMRAVPFELEDDIPFSQEEAIFEAKIIRLQKTSSNVLTAAVPKASLRELILLAREAGFDPSIVSIEGLAMANLVEDWEKSPAEEPELAPTPEARPTDLIVNIGHNHTVVTAFQDKAIIMARSIDFGGKQIAEVLASRYNLLYLEALKELQKKAFVLLSREGATPDQVAFSDLIQSALEPLVQGLRLSILEMSAHGSGRVSQIRLTGGVSQIQNLGPYLTQALDVPVNRLKILEQHPWAQVEITPRIAAVCTASFAYAIEGLRRPRNPAINLLKDEFAPRSETWNRIWTKWGNTVQLACAFFVLFLVYAILRGNLSSSANDQLNEVLKAQAAKIAGLQGRQASTRNIRRFVKQKKAEALGREDAEAVKNLNSALDVLNEISRAMPSRAAANLVLRSLKISNSNVEISGDAPQAVSIDSIRKVLESLAVGGKVSVQPSSLAVPAGRSSFQFRFQVARK